jgi:Fe2+ transport system protein FeoA
MRWLRVLQLNSRKGRTATGALAGLRTGESAIIERIDLPGADARRLMELGFLPGTRVTVGRSAPGGDPRVFQVDGSEIAIRRQTALHIEIKPVPAVSEDRL